MPDGSPIAISRSAFKALAAITLTAFGLLAGASAWADPPGRVGRIAEASGTVWLYDGEQGEWVAAQRNRPLTTGDRLSLERDARTEVQIGSATLRVDGGSEFEVAELDDAHVRLVLHHGSVALRVRSAESAREFEVTTQEGRFIPQRAGHYRIDQEDNGSFGGVIAGSLHFEARDSALDLNGGQRAEFWNDNGVTHYSWSTLPGDRFANWVAQQDRQEDRVARSRPYVSPEMTGAEDLYRYGDWDNHPEYGSVWYPRQVAPGWAPYRYGHWAYVRPWGYTWVDDAPWGFAPFHYGRWVWWGGRWAWAPGQYVARPVYAPALVAWVGGPSVSIGINVGGGPAVGWVPLSPREVYRPTYNVTNVYVTNVNSPYRRWHNEPPRTGPIMYTNQGVPGGVTVVSQNVLRERRPISSSVIAPVDVRTVQRWQNQPLQPQQPAQRGDERRPQAYVPPPPAPAARVVAVPGGGVPAAPGAVRSTPWGRVAPFPQPAAQAATSARDERVERNDRGIRNERAERPAQQPGRPPLSDPRGGPPPAMIERPAAVAPAAPAVAAPTPQRERQDRRPGNEGNGDARRAARQAAPPAVPQAAPPQPVQAVRAAPQAVQAPAPQPPPAVVQAPPAQQPPGQAPEHARQRGRGEGNERGNDRGNERGDERRRERQQQQNN